MDDNRKHLYTYITFTEATFFQFSMNSTSVVELASEVDTKNWIGESASLHGVHPTLIHSWEKQAAPKARLERCKALEAQLYEQIDRVKNDLDLREKKLPV